MVLGRGLARELLGTESSSSSSSHSSSVLGEGMAGEILVGTESSPGAGVVLGRGLERELLGTESLPDPGVLGEGMAGELLGITESSPGLGVVLGRGLVRELFGEINSAPEAGVAVGRGLARELLGTELSLEPGVVLGRGSARELEAGGIELELEEFIPLAARQFGSRSLGVAGAGPGVIATQPGRYGMGLLSPTSSPGIGLGAAHEFISSSELKRPSFSNTGQSSITPDSAVQLSTAR